MLMKFVIQIAAVMAFAVLASAAVAKQQQPVFACSINKLSADERAALSTAVHQLIDAKPTTKELASGYEMRFDHAGQLYTAATTWIEYERICCPFFAFSISLENNDGPLTIRLTGPKGVKAFIDGDLPALKQMAHGK